MTNSHRIALGAGLALLLLSQLTMASARASIGAAEAGRIALERVPGTVEEIERDHESGKEVFEVEVRTKEGVKYEVVIDASDGAVLWAHEDH